METILQPVESQWSVTQRLFFRFVFLYFITCIFLNPNTVYPVIKTLYEGFNTHIMYKIIPWVGTYILRIPYEIATLTDNGSGDTTYDYVCIFFCFALAVLGTSVWSLLDRKSTHYTKLYYWFTVVIRYYLIYNLLLYGLAKVYKTQFPAPFLTRLVQPYGNSSPMGLAWTFLGYSKLYNYFMGFAELLPAFLLMFRRTQTIGALIGFAVMLNVFMINLGYDVCVKILSFHLCLMLLLLAGRDLKKVVSFFSGQLTPVLSPVVVPVQSRKWRLAKHVVKFCVLFFLVGYGIYTVEEKADIYGADAPKPPLYGIYHVTSFVRNNDTIPLLATDTSRWNRLVIPWKGLAQVRLMNDTLRRVAFEPDTMLKKIVLYRLEDTLYKNQFRYQFTPDSTLLLHGSLWGDSVRITMKRYDENKYRLVNRGFHWINEVPFNR